LARGAQGLAFLRGAHFVTPDLVKRMSGPVLEHRLIIRPQAAAVGKTVREILSEILEQVRPPV
jgi:MoxR-like ATPase